MSSRDYIKSPLGLFIIYLAVSFLLIVLFQFVFPADEAPLRIYFFIWRCNNGLEDFLYLLPALILSGILIPFGLLYYDDSFSLYSPRFLNLMKGPIVTAIAAALLYVCSVFLFVPLSQQAAAAMRFQARLFTEARERVLIHAVRLEWAQAIPFINTCERIWPNNPDINSILETVDIRDESITSVLSSRRTVPYSSPEAPPANNYDGPATAGGAISMAREALEEERYYDAHWLATLALRLAQSKSQEQAQAASLADAAWQAIGIVPELESHDLYNRKRDGYDAFLAENWIKAYYIFDWFIEHSLNDSEIDNFFAITLNEIQNCAFFVDELEQLKMQIFNNLLLSIPDTSSGSRIILRMEELSIQNGYSSGRNVEIIVLDSTNTVRLEVKADYSKVVPVLINNQPQTRFILQALGRYDEELRWDPVFSPSEFAAGYLTFDITYNDFLALTKLSTSTVDQLSVLELFTAARQYSSFGYLKPIFYAELLYRFVEAMFFMPLTIIILAMGWRYRAKNYTRFFIIVFCLIAPVIFMILLSCYRSILNILIIGAIVSFGFPLSAVLFIAGDIMLFIGSLLVLAKS